MTFQDAFNSVQFSSPWWALGLPVLLMAIDFATGYINACIKHERDSAKMRQGGGKKFAEFCCICVAQLFVVALDLSDKLVYLVSFYIIFMETVSIIENVKKLGVKVPSGVDDMIDHMDDDLNSGWEMEHSATEDDDAEKE